jgi:DNA/RNA endonuclease YhcR with UshA esterase domain
MPFAFLVPNSLFACPRCSSARKYWLMKAIRLTKRVIFQTRTLTALNIFVLSFVLGIAGADAAVKTSEVNKTDLAAVNTDMVDSTVEVEATIKSITPPREGSRAPYRFELTDSTGSITLVIWSNLYETIKSQSPLSAGDVVHVSGKVSMYRDSLQLQIAEAGNVKVLKKGPADKPSAEPAPAAAPPPAPAAPAKAPATTEQPAAPGTTPVASITAALIGKDVTVLATISEVREPREGSRAPYMVTLTEDAGHIVLVYWSDMQPQLKDKIKVGNRVRINGQVSDYRGTLQLKIRSATDVTVVSGS